MKVIKIDTEEALRKALDVRFEVFVDEQGVPREEEMDQYDASPASARHLLLEIDGEPAAAGRFIAYKPDTAKMQRIAVRRTYRGRGVGRELMLALESWAKEEGFTNSLLDAQCQAEPFYRSLGYAAVSPETFLDAGIPHVRMTKPLI